MRGAVLFLALALVFSGCLADDDGVSPDASSEPLTTPGATTMPSSSASAPAPTVTTTTTGTPAPPPPVQNVDTPFAYDATTHAYLCIHVGSTPTCQDIAAGQADDQALDAFGAPGAFVAVDGNATWDDAQPGAEVLILRLVYETGGVPSSLVVEGGSPLPFSWDLWSLNGEGFRVQVEAPTAVDGALVTVVADPGIDVHVEGSLVSRV